MVMVVVVAANVAASVDSKKATALSHGYVHGVHSRVPDDDGADFVAPSAAGLLVVAPCMAPRGIFEHETYAEHMPHLLKRGNEA